MGTHAAKTASLLPLWLHGNMDKAHEWPPGDLARPHESRQRAAGIPDVQLQPRGPVSLPGNRRYTLD